MNIIITNQTENYLSVFNKETLYCFEPIHYILHRNIQYYQNISNIPSLLILQDCFNMPKEIIEEIFALYKSNKSSENVRIYDRENKIIIAQIYNTDNPEDTEFENLTVGYTPMRSFRELREKNQAMQKEIIARHEDNGVQFASLDGVGISPFVKIAPGTVIYQGTIIRGQSNIGTGTVLGPNTIINNSSVGCNCVINSTQVYSSIIENDVKIGPFCHIRPNCVIKNGVKIGDFVEVKNSNVGENTHASHLTYIGDSDVGKNVNFGCGTVTVNYDGIKKARCTISDGAFIGCNTNLVAPVTIGDDAFTAAGSTITANVPADALAISRSREQKIIEHWVSRRKKIK